jgi:hypothetical protein
MLPVLGFYVRHRSSAAEGRVERSGPLLPGSPIPAASGGLNEKGRVRMPRPAVRKQLWRMLALDQAKKGHSPRTESPCAIQHLVTPSAALLDRLWSRRPRRDLHKRRFPRGELPSRPAKPRGVFWPLVSPIGGLARKPRRIPPRPKNLPRIGAPRCFSGWIVQDTDSTQGRYREGFIYHQTPPSV